MVILGTLKIITGVFFSPLLAQLFVNAPTSLIGVLLGVAGLQLCAVTVDLGKGNQQELFMVAILVAATVLGFANDGIGFMVGVVALSALAIGRRREGTGRQAYSVC